ncbi:hypothetical protein OG607_24270 [Streptomyces sp. NBC_01537]|jgi:hypothetical protein|uniref:hypothetical protein n=1 Tax=Streptomyces sp. NBC_01537 TaxID=2903896 RepID=UPI0038698740
MNLNAITIHRSQHDAAVPTGPADLALPFAVPVAVAMTENRAPELVTNARSARNRRRSGSAARRRAAA